MIIWENITIHDISVTPSIGHHCSVCHVAGLPMQTCFLTVPCLHIFVSLGTHIYLLLCLFDLGAKVGCVLFLETVIL